MPVFLMCILGIELGTRMAGTVLNGPSPQALQYPDVYRAITTENIHHPLTLGCFLSYFNNWAHSAAVHAGMTSGIFI